MIDRDKKRISRKRTPLLFMLLFAISTVAINAQTPEKPAPGFKLTLRGISLRGMEVLETNISKEVINEGICFPLPIQRGYTLEVVYNGVRLEMDETLPYVKLFKEAREGKVQCGLNGMGHAAQPGMVDQPGGSFADEIRPDLFYDVSKPGTYEVTVTKETFPYEPEKSVTVRSNTVTMVVQEPESDATK